MVQMTLSAFLPQVTSLTSGSASSMLAAVWVAPNFVAISRLNGTGSMAKIRSAPARRAPWMAAGTDTSDADDDHVVAGPAPRRRRPTSPTRW